MFKKILVPVDLTHNELGVQMIKLAKEIGGDSTEIVLTHVVHDIPAYAAVEISSEILDKTHKWAKAEIEKLAKDNGVTGAADLRHGSAGSAILEAAAEHGVDLIVIGSHKPGMADYFLGSTAGRVVRHAQCPVLVMR